MCCASPLTLPGRWPIPAIGRVPPIDKARDFIDSHLNTAPDPYTLAVIANFATEYGHDRDFTRRSMQALLDARTEKDDQVFWSAEETGVYSTGASAAIETTGLATQALLKWGQASETARKALNFISSKEAGLRRLGHHPGHHHGSSRLAAGDAAERELTCTDRST